jgi:hypothetical protein
MRKDSLGELVHWIMEAEKSHNMPLTSLKIKEDV